MMTRDLLAYLAGVPCFLFRAAIDLLVIGF